MSIHNSASGGRHLEGVNVADFKVFCRKGLTEPENLGITIFGAGGMGTSDRNIMSIMLLRQHFHTPSGGSVVNQDLIVIPLGRSG